MKFIKFTSILLSVCLLIGMSLYLLFILPEYLACINCIYEGDVCQNIWGFEVECSGESEDLG